MPSNVEVEGNDEEA